jgi:hypothetical protein
MVKFWEKSLRIFFECTVNFLSHFFAGNNWGDCGDGTSAQGCGPQETFRACSDISVKPMLKLIDSNDV